MKFFDGKEHAGATSSDASIIIPLTLVAQCLTMPLGPILTAKLGASRTMLLGTLLAASGVIIHLIMKWMTEIDYKNYSL